MAYPEVLVHLRCWTLSHLQNQRCHLGPGCLHMNEVSNLHKEMDTGRVHVVRHVHVSTMFHWALPWWSMFII